VNIAKIRDKIIANPAILRGITDEQALAAASDIVAELDSIYEKDLWRWACDLVVTQDEASGAALKFPKEREYIHDLFDIFQAESLIAIPKSRRVFVTWAAAVYLSWRARYKPYQALFVQSESEDKAAFVIDKRMVFLEDHLPLAFRRSYKAVRTVKGAVGQITYDGTKSYAKGIAQGRDALRAYTPSVVVLDESEFQMEGRQSLIAALPFQEKGAQLILISTSNGSSGPLADIARSAGFVSYLSMKA
jgi:hypothetical protein